MPSKVSKPRKNQAPTPAVEEVRGGSDKSPHKVWSGMLSFGLVSMPVSLYTAATSETISFNQLHEPCMGRIKQQTHCPKCNEVVDKKSLLKGYEIEKGRYVVVNKEELEAAEPASARVLELREFIPAEQIDPLFFESSYYLGPQDGGQQVYALVRDAMKSKNVVGIARIVRSSQEHICAIRPYKEGLILHYLFWNDEVRNMTVPALPATTATDVTIAEQLIEALLRSWNPAQYKDSYRHQVMQLIHDKHAGKAVTAAATTAITKAPVVDIASALRASLAAARAQGAA